MTGGKKKSWRQGALAVGVIGAVAVYVDVYWVIPALRPVGVQLRQMGPVGQWLGLALVLGMVAAIVVLDMIRRWSIRLARRKMRDLAKGQSGS